MAYMKRSKGYKKRGTYSKSKRSKTKKLGTYFVSRGGIRL
jgi:hypothetical protein